jgi:hypothetical protein
VIDERERKGGRSGRRGKRKGSKTIYWGSCCASSGSFWLGVVGQVPIRYIQYSTVSALTCCSGMGVAWDREVSQAIQVNQVTLCAGEERERNGEGTKGLDL